LPWHDILSFSVAGMTPGKLFNHIKLLFMASKLLAGFALGVLAGVLLAPDKGSETRRKISERGRDLKNKFNDFVDSIQDKLHSVKKDAEEFVDETAQKARAYSTDSGNTWAG
jgi:gas vesicle protein